MFPPVGSTSLIPFYLYPIGFSPTHQPPPLHMVQSRQLIEPTPLEWDWLIEHEDRKKEAQADASMHDPQPFQVDRRVLKDVVWEKMGAPVGRIKFLSSGQSISIPPRSIIIDDPSGTFHKVRTPRSYSYDFIDFNFNPNRRI